MAAARKRAARRTPLSRERVLEAAVAFADEHGVEALSMRRLAKELGVEAMSLYNHVANKDEILRGIIDAVVAEVELPADAEDWKTAIRRSATSVRDMYLRHRWASALSMSRQSGGPAGLRRADWLLRTLREADLSDELTYHAYHILEAYVLGTTVQHLSVPYTGEELAGMASTFLERFPTDEFPDLAEHIRQHTKPRRDQGGFELGLDLILEGLERLRDAPPQRAKRTSRGSRA